MKFKISKEKFAIIKAKGIMKDAFANIDDGKEISVVISEKNIDKKKIIKIQSGYKIISFEAVLPFSLVGFIAKISRALAEENIPIFVISTYSTDKILINDKYVKKAAKKLNSLGFKDEKNEKK